MPYSTHCECGAELIVEAVDAGASLPCECGRQVKVPPLSKLRKTAGESEFPRNTLAQIENMIANGELPQDQLCPGTERPANTTVWLRIQCEAKWVRGDGESGIWVVLASIVFGWFSLLLLPDQSEPEELGRDTFVDLPLRISSDFLSEFEQSTSAKGFQKLMRKTSIYAQLLDEFPDAAIDLLAQRSE